MAGWTDFLHRGAGLVLLGALVTATAATEGASSRYTSLAPADCTLLRENDVIAEFVCDGLLGWQAIVVEVDLRMQLRLRKEEKELDSGLRLLPFNELADTLEWRGRTIGDAWRPYALIQRWYISDNIVEDRPPIQRLYVFRFDPDADLFCVAGFVEVAGNPDHNRDARELTDRVRDATACPEPPDDPLSYRKQGP